MRQVLDRLEDSRTGRLLPASFHCELPAERLEQARATAAILGDEVYKRFPWAHADCGGSVVSALPTTSTFDTWTEAQEKGGWWGTLPAALTTPAAPAAQTRPFAFLEPQFDGDAGQFPLHFLPYASSAFLDGSLAHLPWLQEMPDPLTSAMWSSWIEINPTTAAKLGIRDGDIVEVASSQGTLRTAVIVSPGIAPDLVAMPAGQGHQTFTRYASGRGENPVELLAPVTAAETGSLAWAATRVP
jgi:anaerobic selenocysteine-containing dehydrogenase